MAWKGIVVAALALAVQLVYAQQHTHNEAGMQSDPPLPPFNATGDEPMSFALFPDNKGYLYTHVVFMILAFWVLTPMGIMFGVARSSLHVPTQLLAVIVALIGFFFGKLYSSTVPQFYAGNSHSTLGWFLFFLTIIQLAVGLVRIIANAVGESHDTRYARLETEHLFNHTSSDSSDCLNRESAGIANNYQRMDGDGFEYDSDDLFSQDDFGHEDTTPPPLNEKPSRVTHVLSKLLPYIPNVVKKVFITLSYNTFTRTICRYFHLVVGRAFILLIFTQTLSGLVVYHGVCRSWQVLACIAHLIKGGIFFFYGILTFARYLGSFADRGWAWNRLEQGNKFSFEMVESCLIFTYGITNTWMEHFGQNPEWTHKDLEHASLAFMWWWCGLLGILVESRALRRLLERSVMSISSHIPLHETSRSFSFNPFPAMVVLFTGVSMGNHHQDTIYSTSVHYLWGLLLGLAAICRLITYLFLFSDPPKSPQPSRPPSEAVGAFLMIAGSILFMASNSGTMTWLRRNEVDSMFIMNVCIALTSMTLCYVTFLVILKSWAVKREAMKRA